MKSKVKAVAINNNGIYNFSNDDEREFFALRLAVTASNRGTQAEAFVIENFPVKTYFQKAAGQNAPDFLLEDGRTIQCKCGEARIKGQNAKEAVTADFSTHWILVAANLKGFVIVTKEEMLEKIDEIAIKEKTGFKLRLNEKNLRLHFKGYQRIEEA